MLMTMNMLMVCIVSVTTWPMYRLQWHDSDRSRREAA